MSRFLVRVRAVASALAVSSSWAIPAAVADPAPAATASPACEVTDRLPACRANPATCHEALQQTPQGDPVQLACSAEAACLAGRAGSCAALVQFLGDAHPARDLTAHAAGFEAACAGGQKGACTVEAALLEARLKRAPPSEQPELKLRMVRAAARACALGAGCQKVAAQLDAGGAGAAADETAAAALEAACKGGADAAACAWVTKAYGDLATQAGRQTGCKAGTARACAAEAAEQKLTGGDPDPWLASACAHGDCTSCVLRLRDDKGRLKVTGDHAYAVAARTTCDKACATGRMSACNQTHDLRVSGVGGARDEAGAVLARLPACKLDPAACVLLAGAWIVAADQAIDGEVTSRFTQLCASTRDGSIRRPVCDAPGERGRVRADRAKCAGGDDAVCTSLGRRLRDMGLHAQAADYLDGACQRGRADACAALVDVRERGLDLPPLATDVTAKLKAAAKKACEGGDGVACYELAQTEAQGGAAARKALQLLSSKCKQDGTIACRMAADLCEGYGRKLADDPKKAASLRESGCKAGDARACVAAGVQVDQDSEDPQSGEKAGQLFLRACALGEAEGCVRLQRVQPAPSGAVEQLAKACKAGVLDVCAP